MSRGKETWRETRSGGERPKVGQGEGVWGSRGKRPYPGGKSGLGGGADEAAQLGNPIHLGRRVGVLVPSRKRRRRQVVRQTSRRSANSRRFLGCWCVCMCGYLVDGEVLCDELSVLHGGHGASAVARVGHVDAALLHHRHHRRRTAVERLLSKTGTRQRDGQGRPNHKRRDARRGDRTGQGVNVSVLCG